MTPLIRPIKPEDAPALQTIIVNTLHEFGIVHSEYLSNPNEIASLYDLFNQPGNRYWTVLLDETIVGGGGYTQLPGTATDERICELQKLYFTPQVRGAGIGRLFLSIAIQQAQQDGYTTMYLETAPELSRCTSLYERFGFQFTKKRRGCTGHNSCSIFMERSLTESFCSPGN